jgi:hypothetical protein
MEAHKQVYVLKAPFVGRLPRQIHPTNHPPYDNVDDRKPVPNLVKSLTGKLFGDRGYISKPLTQLLAAQDITLITTLKKHMKAQAIDAFDQLLLRKRSLIETINGQLKNIGDLEHSRHRSLTNYMSNIIASLVAYSYQDKKPALQLRKADLLPLLLNA